MAGKFKWLILAMMLVLSGCRFVDNAKPLVLSTTGMIHDAVCAIAGDRVSAKVLMGPGVDPHLYRMRAGDIALFQKSTIIFYNGLNLEAQLGRALSGLSTKKTVRAISNGIPRDRLIMAEDHEDNPDPHIWFDIDLWREAVQTVTQTLSETMPEHADTFRKNAATYDQLLRELDTWVAHQIATIPAENRVLITAHDAFSYLEKRYGITVVGLQGMNTLSETSPADITRVTSIILNRSIPTIYVESSVPVRQIEAVQAAVRAKGKDVAIGPPLFTDAMGAPGTPEGTYVGMITTTIRHIVEGLTP